MKLNEIANCVGATKPRKRVGRGIGSGLGKTAGRGAKGQKSRSGVAIKGFEGGQMPIYRRLPKRGFNNPLAKRYSIVNVGRIQQAIDANKLDAGTTLTSDVLLEAGVVTKVRDGIRLLAKGDITTKVVVVVSGASQKAIAAVEKLGGVVTCLDKRNG